ncbi:MAG: MBL fold metallo-hydrolase [Patescibacteria group bacterium]
MIIKKFLHSCLLLEKEGQRLLIDPGSFSFIEGKVKPEDIGPVDAILITHKHADHYDPAALRQFLSFGPTVIHTIQDIRTELDKEGIASQLLTPGDERQIATFNVKVLNAPHEAIPVPVLPDNAAYLVDGLLHPGDSFHPEIIPACDTLALPIAGPWATIMESLNFLDRVKPKTVIPIHDAIIKDFMLERIYNYMLKPTLEARGITFRPLEINEPL